MVEGGASNQDPTKEIIESLCKFAASKDFALPAFVERAKIGLDLFNTYEIMHPVSRNQS